MEVGVEVGCVDDRDTGVETRDVMEARATLDLEGEGLVRVRVQD